MNIILVGFMGSGKSAVGHKLAEKLCLSYLDTDQLIEEAAGLSIKQIFAQKGEQVFRDLETEVLQKLQGSDGHVIATGGGMVLRRENVELLRKLGPLVLLWAGPEVIFQRIKGQTHRPLLNVPDPLVEIKKILAGRKAVYDKVADLKVDTSKLNVAQAAERIEQWLASK